MTSRDRVFAVLEGRNIDRMPVAALYLYLYQQDHFEELTGQPEWELLRWLHSDPEAYVRTYQIIMKQTPFEMLQPSWNASRYEYENVEYMLKDNIPVRHDKKTDTYEPLSKPISGHASDYAATEQQTVFDLEDARKIKITRSEEMIASGANDYVEAVVKALGKEHFIICGAVVGTVWGCSTYVGQTNTFAMMMEQPDLIAYLCEKLTEQNLEHFRCYAASGGDAVWIDDATATCDMISVSQYERFSLPYMQQMVKEIHRLGLKAILVYYGGVADRLEQIASIGADGLSVEASMKGFINDINEIAERIGDKVTLFANLNPISILQNGSDEEMAEEIQRQITAGRKARGFIISPASPITPATPLTRVKRFIELSQRSGVIT